MVPPGPTQLPPSPHRTPSIRYETGPIGYVLGVPDGDIFNFQIIELGMSRGLVPGRSVGGRSRRPNQT